MENPIKMGWFGGTTIFGNTQMLIWLLSILVHLRDAILVKWHCRKESVQISYFKVGPGYVQSISIEYQPAL